MKIIALLTILATLIQPVNAAVPAPQAELRVCASGCPYTIIQDAIDAADPEDSILIAAGTYSDLNTLGGLNQIAYITKSLTLRGGYSPDFNTWDPATYITTLDATSAGRAIYANGHTELTLVGLHLTNGNATGLGGDWFNDNDAGGAVFIKGGIVTMTDCTVENSIAGQSRIRPSHGMAQGGGIYIDSSTSATLTHNLIRNNTTATVDGDYLGWGGGIALYFSDILLEDNTITGNIATTQSLIGEGGGMLVYGGTVTLNNNTITFNTASQSPKAPNTAGYGGGIRAYSPVTMTGNLIANNTAGDGLGYGAGLHLEDAAVLTDNQILRNNCTNPGHEYQTGTGGGLYLFSGKNALITGNLFEDNLGGERGGGIYLDEGSPTLIGNIIRHNRAAILGYGAGGGLYLEDAPAHLVNNQIIENIASGYTGFGGGIYLARSDATLTGNLISDNWASVAFEHWGGEWGEGRGGGVAIVASSPQLTANQITDNVSGTSYYDTNLGGGVYLENTGATLSHNLVSGNTASTMSNGYGGGIYIKGWHGAAPVLDGNVITNNNASFKSLAIDGFGGGVAIYRICETAPVILRNNVIANNDSDDYGSGLWVGAVGEDLPVGVVLEHNTFANNKNGDAAISLQYALTVEMSNNIISGHNMGVFAMENGTVTMDGTLWHQNTVDTGGAGTITHTNDLTGDPLYADAANFNYHLTAGSAARDAALASGVASDLDGQTRPNPDTNLPDLGADEYYVTPPSAVTISGPDTAYLGLSATFTAHTSPADTTLPLTYTWQATGQSPVTHTGGLVDTVQFTWAEPGEKQITVTVTSAHGGPVTTIHTVMVLPIEIKKMYFPLVLR